VNWYIRERSEQLMDTLSKVFVDVLEVPDPAAPSRSPREHRSHGAKAEGHPTASVDGR